MRNLDMNIVISAGLVMMGIVSVGGWIALSIITGTSSGTEIPIAIISGLGGVLTGKNLAERQSRNSPQEETKKGDPRSPSVAGNQNDV